MRITHFCFVFATLLFAFVSCQQKGSQAVTPNPKIRLIPGGVEITPDLSGNKDQIEKIKSVRLVAKPIGEGAAKPIEKDILLGQPYRLILPGSFTYQLTYLGGNNQTLGISNQTVAASDSMTWDVVVSLALPGSTGDRCNCNAQNSVLTQDPSFPNERSLTWGPSTSTNQDMRRITVTNPSTGESASTIVFMKPDGTLSLITRSGSSHTCLTEGGFTPSSDSRSVIYSASSLFFSIRSHYVVTGIMSLSQRMTITCPAGYTVTVEKLTCS
jgi:hypothetical protein